MRLEACQGNFLWYIGWLYIRVASLSEELNATLAPGRVVDFHGWFASLWPWVVAGRHSLTESGFVHVLFRLVASELLLLLVALSLGRILLIGILLLVATSEHLVLIVIGRRPPEHVELWWILFVALGVHSPAPTPTESVLVLLLVLLLLTAIFLLVALIHVVLLQSRGLVRGRFIESQTELTLSTGRVLYFDWSTIVASEATTSVVAGLLVLLLAIGALCASILLNCLGGSACVADILWRHLAIVAVVGLLLVRRLVSLLFFLVALLELVAFCVPRTSRTARIVPTNAPLGVAAYWKWDKNRLPGALWILTLVFPPAML